MRRPAKRPAAKAAKPVKKAKPRILSGGNPQIAKGEGDAPVKAYIAAIPVVWKREIVRRLDKVIAAAVPGVRKAVKWNSPFYGAGPNEEGWFLAVHCYTNFVKVSFFRGRALKPPPPGPSKQPEVRYLDVREGQLDEAQFADWVRQASGMAGVKM